VQSNPGWLLFLPATTAAFLLPVSAWSMDGDEILAWCKDTGPYTQGICQGFVQGVAATFADIDQPLPLRLCLPANASRRQVVDIVVRYLETHPERRHSSANSLVWTALHDAFPCKTE
jgi:hypothetical protein